MERVVVEPFEPLDDEFMVFRPRQPHAPACTWSLDHQRELVEPEAHDRLRTAAGAIDPQTSAGLGGVHRAEDPRKVDAAAE
ncbi:MAG TPA: hypothetical protein VFD39_14035 [Trueperaceae bacterium]|nr:hypothetical protein [Trueperaceae bacterium]